jgi:hypothetical protein
MSSSNPKLYIRKVSSDVNTEKIKQTFNKFGIIKSIKTVPWTHDSNFNRIYITFIKWDKHAEKYKNMILNDQILKVFYDCPYFWSVVQSKF